MILSADYFGGLKNNLVSNHIMATVTLPKEKLELVYSQLNFLRNYVGLWSLKADEYVVSAVAAPVPAPAPVVAAPVVAAPVVVAPVVAAPVVVEPVVATSASLADERLIVEPTVSASPSSSDTPSLFGSFSRSFRS